MNKLAFPPIDTTVFDREGLKEMYIFKHPTDPYCPIILHFPLVNIDFREFKKPGIFNYYIILYLSHVYNKEIQLRLPYKM